MKREEKETRNRGNGEIVDGLLTTNALMVAAFPWFEDWCSADVLKPPFIRASLGAPLDASTHHLWDTTELLQISLPLPLSFSLSPLVLISSCNTESYASAQICLCTFVEIHPFDPDRIDCVYSWHTSRSIDSMTNEREKWTMRHLISRKSQEFI